MHIIATEVLSTIAKYTNWSVQTRFSSVVQHQNLDESVDQLLLDRESYPIKYIKCPGNAADAWIATTPVDDGTTHVALEYYSDALENNLAEVLVDRL